MNLKSMCHQHNTVLDLIFHDFPLVGCTLAKRVRNCTLSFAKGQRIDGLRHALLHA